MTDAGHTVVLYEVEFTETIYRDKLGCQRDRIVGREQLRTSTGVDIRNGRLLPVSPTGHSATAFRNETVFDEARRSS